MSRSIEDVKGEIFTGMREQWAVPELDDSQLTFIDTISMGWRSHVILASMVSEPKTSPKQSMVIVKTFSPHTAQQALEDEGRISKLLMYFKREAGIWRKIGTHPNIAEISGIMQSFHGSILPVVVSPYYPKQDLRQLVENDGNIKLSIRLSLLRDVASGLEYCACLAHLLDSSSYNWLALVHSLTPQVVHRDIKGSNILVKEEGTAMVACISDFGSAKFLDQTGIDMAYTTMMSSIQWTPPEFIVDGRPSYSNPTTYGDIWSFGCTFLEILKGGDPWGQDDEPMFRLKAKKHPPKPTGMAIDDSVWSIMKSCWKEEAEARIDAAGIVLYMDIIVD